MELRINNESELPEAAKKINAFITSKIVLVNGEMGAGKTTLIKSLCDDLGSNDTISSPTFSLVNHYLTKDQKDIFHFDFYRITSIEEALDIGFEEYLEKDAICFIEWSDMVKDILPDDCAKIQIDQSNGSRILRIS